MSTDGQDPPAREPADDPNDIAALDFTPSIPCAVEECRDLNDGEPFEAELLVRSISNHYPQTPLAGICGYCWEYLGEPTWLACADCGTVIGHRDQVFSIQEVLE